MNLVTILIASICLVLMDGALLKFANLSLLECGAVCGLALLAVAIITLIFNIFTNQK